MCLGGVDGSDDAPHPSDPPPLSQWQLLADDFAAVLGADVGLGERVHYLSHGDAGAPIPLDAVVHRMDDYFDEARGMTRRTIQIRVPNLSDGRGLAIVEKGLDFVDVPLLPGGAPQRCRVLDVRERTRVGWTLEVAP